MKSSVSGLIVLSFALPLLTTAQSVTFNKDVAPILYKNCVACHHANDIAPMSLMTYKEARPWGAAIREAVVRRVMPPGTRVRMWATT